MNLYSWGGADSGVASVDPFCLTVQAYMRFVGAEFTLSVTNDPRTSPSGDLPMLVHGDEVVAGAAQVINYLRSQKQNADFHLSPKDKADTKAFCSLVEDQLFDAQLHAWWCTPPNYDKTVRPLYVKLIPFPWNYILPQQMKSNVEWRLKQHAERVDGALQPDEPVYIMARHCYSALSAKLGTQNYFFGDTPTTLDAVVYGHLAVQYYVALPNHKLKTSLDAFPNLVAFLQRIQQVYFSDWTPKAVSGSVPASPQKSPRKSPRKVRQTPEPTNKADDDDKVDPAEAAQERKQLLVSSAIAFAAVAGFVLFNRLRSGS